MTEKLSEPPATIYLVPADEYDTWCWHWCEDPAPGIGMKEEDAIRYVRADETAALERQLDRWYELYAAVNEMMAELGKVGEINTRHADVGRVMDVLHDIDGGDYLTREQLQKRLDAERGKG